jgi:hypothetical protein
MSRVVLLIGLVVSLLVGTEPDAVAVPTGTAVTPTGWDSRTWSQDTDSQGDTAYAFASGQGGTGALYLRIRRSDGTVTPVVEVAPTQGFSQLLVTVDRDGDGAVVWMEGLPGSDPAWRLNARPFTRNGGLGPLLDLAPGHDPTSPAVGSRPDGSVVVAWSDNTADPVTGYVPYARTIRPDSSLGPVLRLGDGPNSGPLLAVAPDGDTVLVNRETTTAGTSCTASRAGASPRRTASRRRAGSTAGRASTKWPDWTLSASTVAASPRWCSGGGVPCRSRPSWIPVRDTSGVRTSASQRRAGRSASPATSSRSW